ncbi:hypothetical protein SISSUDRAFT_1057928 [Sistotremastrum suecicum HHB10207 ss-3]|uniref:RanBD1 domain-containing protein n=1 Tax=Sistotremastrum suecicum HHB10207 ss-3 TaxID=1314776 RepID=A0A166HX19_9AGAM|nr:hypothetical protein SISSUDRAFT_1057928 [Sistotremastrum suecicum HHB10207 ss-3]
MADTSPQSAPLPITPPSPASPSDETQEVQAARTTRKREREISIEPSTPKDDDQTDPSESKEHHIPTKKNRLQSISPEDEDDEEANPHTPPTATSALPITSPAHESKVTHIGQRVKDLSWKDKNPNGSDSLVLDQESDEQMTSNKSSPTPQDPFTDDAAVDQEPAQQPLSDIPDENVQMSQDPVVSQATEGSSEMPNDQPTALETIQSEPDPDKERSLKRKLDVPAPEETPAKPLVQESAKRLRDDSDVDDNPRETKRITPPPATEPVIADTAIGTGSEPASPPKEAPAMSGFLAFASVTSPFATAKDTPFAWGSTSTSSATFASKVPTKPSSSSSVNLTEFDKRSKSPSPAPQAGKPKPIFGMTSAPGGSSFSGGFGAYSSAASPFQSALQQPSATALATSSTESLTGPTRSKSPVRHGNAFSPYNSSARGFGISLGSRRQNISQSSTPPEPANAVTTTAENGKAGSVDGSEDDEKQPSFGDRLIADKGAEEDGSSENKIALEEQEVHTGEEDETTEFSVRGKLYTLSSQKQWRERGTGPLRLNVRKSDGLGARLVMRKEAIHSLILNVPLFKGMKFEIAQDPRYVRFAVPADGKFEQYNLRLSSAKAITELLEAVETHTSKPEPAVVTDV